MRRVSTLGLIRGIAFTSLEAPPPQLSNRVARDAMGVGLNALHKIGEASVVVVAETHADDDSLPPGLMLRWPE